MPDLNMATGLEKLEKKLEHLWKRRRATDAEGTNQSPLLDGPAPSPLDTHRFPSPSFIRPTSTRMIARQDTFMGGSGRRTRSLPDPSTSSSTSELLPAAMEPVTSAPEPSGSISTGPSGPESAPSEPSEPPRRRVTYTPFPPRLDIPRRSSSLSPLQRGNTNSLAGILDEFNFEKSSGSSTTGKRMSPVPSPRSRSRSNSRSSSRPISTAESSKRASEATIKMAISTDTLRPARSRTPGPPPALWRYSSLWDGPFQTASREVWRPISTETLHPISKDTSRPLSTETVKPISTGDLNISSKEPPNPLSTESSSSISTVTSRSTPAEMGKPTPRGIHNTSSKEPLTIVSTETSAPVSTVTSRLSTHWMTDQFLPALAQRPSREELSLKVSPRPSWANLRRSAKSPLTPNLEANGPFSKLSRLQIPEPETSPSLVPLPQSARSDRTVSSYGPVTPTTLSRPVTPMITTTPPFLEGVTVRDFLALTDDDVADPDVTTGKDQVEKQFPSPPTRAAPSPPPSCGLPPNPPLLTFPIPPMSRPRAQRPSDGSELIILPPPLASHPMEGAAAALESYRIASKYQMDLVYVANLWPKKALGQHNPSKTPVRKQASYSSLSTSATVIRHGHGITEDFKLDGRLMAAYGLHLVPSPFKLHIGVLKKLLQTDGWLEYRGDGISDGRLGSLEGFVRGYSQSFFTNDESTRGIVFAGYRRSRPDGSHAIMSATELEEMARDAEALCTMLVDQANSERRMRANA